MKRDRLIYGLANDIDRNEYDISSVSLQAQTVKYLTTSNAICAIEKGLSLIGNPGLSRHNPLERHYRFGSLQPHPYPTK